MKAKKTPQLSTAKQRELGAELRRIRTRAGYLATDMSRILGWPASTISRLESGLRNYQAGDIATTSPERKQLHRNSTTW
ncbi:helix-turn-helix domain-containing protein [Amycolatopsis japonica]|uniref:helix-turn-helix domain-containing protein n=1 Tax=Amycolatopsis japonica TaxID=208439 RepID=UPI0033F93D5A